MKAGIVGSEQAKFTYLGMVEARDAILDIVSDDDVTEIVSGACHLGGIDEWAAELGRDAGKRVTEFPPTTLAWNTGFKPRNLKIAQHSDIVYCITVRRLPNGYSGMRFRLCYHCGTDAHVKSGGCWTMKAAEAMGKPGVLIVVDNGE